MFKLTPSLKIPPPWWLYLSIVGLIYTVAGLSLLYDQPTVWSDEAIYMDLAVNFLNEGRLGVDVWQGLLPGVTEYAGWNPPFYFLVLSGWLGILGTTLTAQRLLSVVLGGIVVGCFGWLTKKWFKSLPTNLWLLLGIGFCVDFVFIRAARYSRPEILILTLLAVNLVVLAHSKWQYRLRFSGLLSGLAILTHPYGILVLLISWCYLWWIDKFKLAHWKVYLQYLGLAAVPTIFWLGLIPGHWDVVMEQFKLAAAKKMLDEWWLWMPSRSQTPAAQISFGLLQLASLVVLLMADRSKAMAKFLLSCLIISWLMVWYGRMMWYAVYPILFIYLGLGYFLAQKTRTQSRQLALGILVGLICANIYLWYLDARNVYQYGLSYWQFTHQVVETIPAGSKVFLSAAPETYFGFFNSNRQHEVIIFPALQTPPADYLAVLNSVDYVVFTANYEPKVFGNFLETYVEANIANYTYVGQETGYQALVIQLIDRSHRQTEQLSLEYSRQ